MSMSRFHDYISQRDQPGVSGLADAAISLGMPVFPCDAKKRPLTLNGFKDATNDPAAIRRLFADHRAVMIGVPTGKISGFVAVDADMKEGQQGRSWLDANSHRLPQTRTHRTLNSGLHILYRWPGQRVKNSASKIAPNIDVRGDGGYVIFPPSAGYMVADDAPIADVPEWLLPAICPPDPVYTAPAPRHIEADGLSILGRATLQQRCDAIRFAPDGAKHTTINESAFAVGGLVSSGHIQQAEGWAALREALIAILPHCKDQRAAQRTLYRAFYEGIGKPQSVEPPMEHADLDITAIAPFLAKLADSRVVKTPISKSIAEPVSIMDVTGALKLFVDYCEATAISPQPLLSLAAAITLVGALAGRRYCTTTDLRTNIYAVGIADSGAGKDHARKQVKKVLFAAGLSRYLGGSDIASGSALRTALMRHPAMLFQVDEFGDWLADVLGDKASAHRKQIASMLKELYSSADLPWQGIEYADQSKTGRPREDIHQPHACLYGTSTPGQFWNAVAGSNMQDGLMARILLFVSPVSYPDEREPSMMEPSDDLIAAVQAIAAGVPGIGGNLAGIMVPNVVPIPYIVPETPEATAARRQMRQDQLVQQRNAEGTYVTAIAARLAESAMKLALDRAVSANPASPIIAAQDVAWGRTVAQHCIDTMLREAGRHVADNDHERRFNRLLEFIRVRGPVTEREIIRGSKWLGERDRTELLRLAVGGGMVQAIASGTNLAGGRPTIRFSVGPPAAE